MYIRKLPKKALMNEQFRKYKTGLSQKFMVIHTRYNRILWRVINNGLRNNFREYRPALVASNGNWNDGITFRSKARQAPRKIMGLFLTLYIAVWFWSVILVAMIQGLGVI